MRAEYLTGTPVSMRKTAVLMGALTVAGLASPPASASTVVLAGSGQLSWTGQFIGSSSGNTQTAPTGQFGNGYSLSVPGQYTFLDTFANQSSPLTGVGSTVGSYAFQDTYQFSLGQAASGDALTVSLNLQQQGLPATFDISNLQLRLYEVPSSSSPGLLIPAGSTIVTAWMGTSGPSSGTSIQASFSNIQPGTYFLDVAGIADGTNGGTYVGQLNLATPVPLPASLVLLISSLSIFGGLRRRRTVATPAF